ncbi:Solute carrier family 35 member F1 [Thelohanellus kitauei]|uniref:Solute carrier family 35 member F1 n=1 Tax=Thelohanellus kitauei TaxID=669202 RepID=A0A0C2MP59_THEKT|nr:Solute carrier family 35 member F1 [Thelohanellus kitauei]
MGNFNSASAHILVILKSETFIFSCISQIGSLCIFAIGVSLEESKVSAYPSIPCFIYLGIHSLLTIIFGLVLYKNGILMDTIKKEWWKYAIVAFCEFESCFLIIMSYHFTNYIVIQFIDCSTIFFVLVLSVIILKKRFFPCHLLGAFVAIAGVVMLIIFNSAENFPTLFKSKREVIGDIMCLIGCLLYTFSNVLSEKFLEESLTIQWLLRIGIFSMPIVLVQGYLRACFTQYVEFYSKTGLWIGLNIACSLAFYIVLPVILNKLGAARVTLLIVTSDLMAIAYESSNKKRITAMFICSIVLAVLGNVIFSLKTIHLERKKKTQTIVNSDQEPDS